MRTLKIGKPLLALFIVVFIKGVIYQFTLVMSDLCHHTIGVHQAQSL